MSTEAERDLIDNLKVTKLEHVQLEQGQKTYTGNLHLVTHFIIFSSNEGDHEPWFPYPIILTVEKGLPTIQGTWPLQIRCHNFVTVSFYFQEEREVTLVYEVIQKLTCVSSVEQLLAFYYTPRMPFTTTDGWQIYDPLKEYERMGVIKENPNWRISNINENYEFSPTYPKVILVPAKISDTVLSYAAKHRSKARIPALSYMHWNKASITRSSQPMVGLKQNRSVQDEKLIEAIFLSHIMPSPNGAPVYGNTTTNLIIDARPTANAVANTAVGAGTENMENYRNCKKFYSGIDNIHVMRDSLNRLVEALQEIDVKGRVSKAALHKSGWLKHVSAVMDGALMIVRNIHISNSHVLVHCSDGWDRTAQLTSLAQICLDPFYRTLRGFQVLVEKEWCSFGYKFMDRCGHLSNDKNFVALSATNAAANTFANVQSKLYNNKHIRETSPVFHQFLDCVFQIMHNNPNRFEFNEVFLKQLHYHIYSCQFGNFLFNCERQRKEYSAVKKCYSLWDLINTSKDQYIDFSYDPSLDKEQGGDCGVLYPDSKSAKYWSALFGRTDDELNGPDEVPIANPGSAMNERATLESLGIEASLAESEEPNDETGEENPYNDPLGSSPNVSVQRMRAASRTTNVRVGPESDDTWQRSADNITSKIPAAITGAFNGVFGESINRWRESWNTRPASVGAQPRAATLGRSNSRRRDTVDRELRSISGVHSTAATTAATTSTTTTTMMTNAPLPSSKYNLSSLTLEHHMGSGHPYSSGGNISRSSTPSGTR
ncbi:hypothetical protein BGW38_005028, partial [Lunasporangiospora selenospora]